MIAVVTYIQRAIDLAMNPLDRLGPAWGIIVSSVVVTALGLVIYKYTSNQDGIKQAKEKIKGHFFEVWLYIDDLSLIARAQGGIFKQGGRYLAYALVPLLVMLAPVMLILINLEFRYDYRPFRPGDEFLVKVELKGSAVAQLNNLKLELPDGVALAAGPVRISFRDRRQRELDRMEADWRLRVEKEGTLPLRFKLGESLAAEQPLYAEANGRPRLDPVRSADFATALWYPPLMALPASSPVQEIRVDYPQADVSFFGWETWWVWPFLLVMLVAAFLLRGLIGVEF